MEIVKVWNHKGFNMIITKEYEDEKSCSSSVAGEKISATIILTNIIYNPYTNQQIETSWELQEKVKVKRSLLKKNNVKKTSLSEIYSKGLTLMNKKCKEYILKEVKVHEFLEENSFRPCEI